MGNTASAKAISPAIRNGQLAANEFWALKDVSFELFTGDVLGIIGKNGAGKSTLLQLLSGIVRPTAGKVAIRGPAASILEVGTGFHPDLTGRENIFFSGTLLGIPKKEIKERFDEIVAFSEIGNFIDSPVKHYSSGMYVRLATAVAVNVNVKLLLLDEVFSAGDIDFKHKVFRKIESITSTGTTVVLITHNMNDVTHFCNKCMLLEGGQKVLLDTPGRAIQRYLGSSLMQSDYKTNVGGADANGLPPGMSWRDLGTAPGTEAMRIKQISIKAAEKNMAENILMTDAFDVEVEFWKLQDNATIQLHLVFFDKLDNPVFSTAVFYNQNGENLAELYKGETGLFKMACRIPGNFLYAGRYSIQLRFGRDLFIDEFKFKEDIHFYIHPSPDVVEYIGDTHPVAVRPVFLWKHLKIGPLK